MIKAIKSCKDCKHFKRKANRFFIGACFNSNLIDVGHPIFEGIYSISIKLARSKIGKCGVEGKYFEERNNG